MLLADDFFLIAHDDRDGRSRLSPKSVELGLAGALITIFGGYQVTFIAGIVFVLLGIVAIIPIRSVR